MIPGCRARRCSVSCVEGREPWHSGHYAECGAPLITDRVAQSLAQKCGSYRRDRRRRWTPEADAGAETISTTLRKAGRTIESARLALELREQRPLPIRATRGVLLTTGGFIFTCDGDSARAEYLMTMAPRRHRLRRQRHPPRPIRRRPADGTVGKKFRLALHHPPTPWAKGVVSVQRQAFSNEARTARGWVWRCAKSQTGRAWLVSTQGCAKPLP